MSPLWIAVIVAAALLLIVTIVAMSRRSSAGIVTSRFGRTARLFLSTVRMSLRLFARRFKSLFISRERREKLEADYHARTAREAFETMGNMKGGLMKLGQIVSFMDESLPQEYREQLSQLQANAPPMDYDVVVRVIRSELGEEPEELFADFDREPLASASIGQVHRARLPDGTDVAVKVQYPGVADAIAADVNNVGMLLSLVTMVLPHVDAAPLVEELRSRMLEELDYVKEADNQRRFKQLFDGHPRIVIPDVYPSHSSERVLTTEYMPGRRFHDFIASATAEEKREAVLAMYRFVFDSIWLHKLFNGDPHPGNYIFLDDGRVAFLDFGAVKDFDPTFMNDFRRLAQLYLGGDKSGYYAHAGKMNIVVPGHEHRVDEDWLWEYSRWFYLPVIDDTDFRFTSEYCKQALQQVFGENMKKLNMPAEYMMLNSISFGLNSILAHLDACENWGRLGRHYYFDGVEPPPSDS